jgi:hypothetical protein
VVFGAITRVLLGVRAAVGVLDAGITLDPAAAEVFILHGLELREPAALGSAERLKLHDILQYPSQEYAATSICLDVGLLKKYNTNSRETK